MKFDLAQREEMRALALDMAKAELDEQLEEALAHARMEVERTIRRVHVELLPLLLKATAERHYRQLAGE